MMLARIEQRNNKRKDNSVCITRSERIAMHARRRTFVHLVVVDGPAILPDLSLVAGLDLDAGHLHHGLLEPVLPPPGDVGVVHHHPGRLLRRQECRVRGEEHRVRQHVVVVLLVHVIWGHHVLHHRWVLAARGGVCGALATQECGKAAVDVGGDVEAVGHEGGAVGAPDGVCTGEDDQVLRVEALDDEAVHEVAEVGRGWDEELDRLGGVGEGAVAAAGRHLEVHLAGAEDAGRVAGRESDDVGAGDDARAGRLEGVLDGVDQLEAAQGGIVGRAELLRRRAERGRVQEDGSITTLIIINSMRLIKSGLANRLHIYV